MSDLLPIGSKVRLTLHAIDGKSETVTGTVTQHNRRGTLNYVSIDPEFGYGAVAVSTQEVEVL